MNKGTIFQLLFTASARLIRHDRNVNAMKTEPDDAAMMEE